MPKVSVIIPCYNQGTYIVEAVDSVLAQTFEDFEIIIVNDGSTDESTFALLKDYKKPKTSIIHIPHQGLAEARNVGIRNSSGKYILPLDADDKISPEYLADAVRVLDADDEIKIVYCNAKYFGEKSGPFKLPRFSMQTLLIENVIFAAAFFRRRDYDLTSGYNKNLVYGYEDWDLWLSLLENGGKVYKIPKTHFCYRFRNNSMARLKSNNVRKYSYKQIYINHIELYFRIFENPISIYSTYYRLRTSLVLKPFRYARRFFLYVKKLFIRTHLMESFVCIRPPRTYHFLMTNYCNARCIFCNQRFNGQSKKEIAFEKFKIMVSNIPVTLVDQFHFSGGGEPLLCHDLIPIIKYVNELFPWIEVIIRTNGLLIGKYAQELARLNIFKIEISIHGGVEINDVILQRKGSQVIFDDIVLLNKYLEEYRKRIYKVFVPTVSMFNINEIPKLIKKADELNVDGVLVYFCRYFPYRYRKDETSGVLKEKDSLFFHKFKYNRVILKSKRLAKSLGVDFSYDPLFFKYLFEKGVCYQPWENMLVDWDGDVYPCCGGEERFKEKVKSGEYNFGNLLKEHIDKCWNGPSYILIRKTCSPACKDKLISECENCHSTVYFKGPNVKNAHIIQMNG